MFGSNSLASYFSENLEMRIRGFLQVSDLKTESRFCSVVPVPKTDYDVTEGWSDTTVGS